jgi:hypothetical protein
VNEDMIAKRPILYKIPIVYNPTLSSYKSRHLAIRYAAQDPIDLSLYCPNYTHTLCTFREYDGRLHDIRFNCDKTRPLGNNGQVLDSPHCSAST